jgi:RNase P protein component
VETKKTNADREEVQRWIREQMKQGQLPTQPEHELVLIPKAKSGKRQNQEWLQARGPTVLTTLTTEREAADVQDDDFFGEDTI